MKVVWTPRALQDLADLYSYIAKDNADAATRTVQRLYAEALDLAKFPYAGRQRGGVALRELVVAPLPYIVRYALEEDVVLITSIRHGARRTSERDA